MLGEKDVEHIARISRIQLNADEKRRMLAELNAIFNMIAEMRKTDVTTIDSLTHIQNRPLRLREDKAAESDRSSELLANAPQIEDGYFLVPKVIE